jgi:hypothetical protein
MNGRPVSREGHDDGAIAIGAKDASPGPGQALHRGWRGMTVRIAHPGGRHRDPRSNRVDEGLGRGGLAPVMRDLQQIEARQARREQLRVDVLFDITREQEPGMPHSPEEHDRHVVDAGATVGWRLGDLTADRP